MEEQGRVTTITPIQSSIGFEHDDYDEHVVVESTPAPELNCFTPRFVDIFAAQPSQTVESKRDIVETVVDQPTISRTCFTYRRLLREDSFYCNKQPSFLVELILYIVNVVNIAIGIRSWQEVTYLTTGGYYGDVPEYIKHRHGHSFLEDKTSLTGDLQNVHIFSYVAYQNWTNLVWLAVFFAALELLRPSFTLLRVFKRGPKNKSVPNAVLQILELVGIILNEAWISICKIILYVKVCAIRRAIASPWNQVSSALALLSAILKAIHLAWNINANICHPRTNISQRHVNEGKEEKVKISSSWYHYILPVFIHVLGIITCVCALVYSVSYMQVGDDGC